MKNRRKSICSSCDKETWHETLFEKNYQDTKHKDYDSCSKSVVTECCGCEQTHYFLTSWTQNKDGSGIDSLNEWVFPPKNIHQSPNWYIDFAFSTIFDEGDDKKHVSDLLRESHIALENNCPRLGIMGIRALLEHMMISKIGDNKSFKDNLHEFQSKGFISKIQCESVKHVLEAGHAAIHRTHTPSQGELIAALEIVEGLIEILYINPDKSRWVSSNVKKR